MKEHFSIYTAKNGSKYIQTKNQYLASALAFCGYRYYKISIEGELILSFQYSDKLLETVEHLIELKNNNK
jgi:hypothetical protein